jgi:hypothetical protein
MALIDDTLPTGPMFPVFSPSRRLTKKSFGLYAFCQTALAKKG